MARRRTPRAPKPSRATSPRVRAEAARDGEHVTIGEVGRTVGMRGEVRVWLHNPDTVLLKQESALELVLPDQSARPARIAELRHAGGHAVVRFEGVEDLAAAEQLRGAMLRIARAGLAPPEPGEYYVWDLERCRVTLAGEPLGVVKCVLPYPTCDVLVITRPDGPELEIPLHDDFVREVRTSDWTIDLLTIDGLP